MKDQGPVAETSPHIGFEALCERDFGDHHEYAAALGEGVTDEGAVAGKALCGIRLQQHRLAAIEGFLQRERIRVRALLRRFSAVRHPRCGRGPFHLGTGFRHSFRQGPGAFQRLAQPREPFFPLFDQLLPRLHAAFAQRGERRCRARLDFGHLGL